MEAGFKTIFSILHSVPLRLLEDNHVKALSQLARGTAMGNPFGEEGRGEMVEKTLAVQEKPMALKKKQSLWMPCKHAL